jgi:hypothetical protein
MTRSPNRKPRKKSYFFTFTLFTSDHHDSAFAILARIKPIYLYFIAGFEQCPTTGKKHLQGYVVFKDLKTEHSVRKLIPFAHIEIAKEGPEANRIYCIKSGTSLACGTLGSAIILWDTCQSLDKDIKACYNEAKTIQEEKVPQSGAEGSITPIQAVTNQKTAESIFEPSKEFYTLNAQSLGFI